MHDFEKLGAFYLGTPYDLAAHAPRDGVVLYDSRDLVTHAVCVGMTGSGKTGLCIGLLEEAAIDGIPAIAIDPKGDLSNLALAFPDLSAAEFAAWVDPEEARRAGVSIEEFAAREAQRWREGLASSGQSVERVGRFRAAAEVAIYTPGSRAGIPVSILKSFAAPPRDVRDDEELFHERVATQTRSLLGLLSIDADPLTSREFLLVSSIVSDAWRAGRDLDLQALIHAIQSPPLERVGVIDLETFYPARERFELALRVNQLIASPSFAAWLTGEPLDVQSALYTRDGRPKLSIFSIAHLPDAERMFFVSLLLHEVLAWARRQSGTQSLRAILYMDEIAGYFPPVREPPSKAPLLTLLKQARAFGLGVVLATQNPVDLDYKGLANAGTWFIGRLQTERDRARVLDALEAAAAHGGGGFDRATLEREIAALDKRVFLLHDVHETHAAVFRTRFTLSYLRGPLTRAQIQTLTQARANANAAPAVAQARPAADARALARDPRASALATRRPVLPPEIAQVFLPLEDGDAAWYRPALLGLARVAYHDAKLRVATARDVARLASFDDSLAGVDWERAEEVALRESDLRTEPEPGLAFAPLPAVAGQAKGYATWKRSFLESVARSAALELWRSADTGVTSQPGSTQAEFRAQLAHAAREARDRHAERLRQKYAPKVATLEERLRRARAATEREREQASQSKLATALSFGATILQAFTGRKALSAGTIGRATSAARGVGRSVKEGQDVERAADTARAIEESLRALEQAFAAELGQLEDKLDPARIALERISLPAKRSGIEVRILALAWIPTSSN